MQLDNIDGINSLVEEHVLLPTIWVIYPIMELGCLTPAPSIYDKYSGIFSYK